MIRFFFSIFLNFLDSVWPNLQKLISMKVWLKKVAKLPINLRYIDQIENIFWSTFNFYMFFICFSGIVRRKTLVLDLDETLIHSFHDGVLRPTVRPGTPPDFILKVTIDRHPVRFFVHKRPHVDFFLQIVSISWCPTYKYCLGPARQAVP